MGVSAGEITARIGEATAGLVVPPSFHHAVALMTDLVRRETVTFFMATRGIGGLSGDVTVDVVALTERRLVEIEFYGDRQTVQVSSFDVNSIVAAGLVTTGSPGNERITVYAWREDGSRSEWSGAEGAKEDLRSLAAHLLRRAGASPDGGLRHAHVV